MIPNYAFDVITIRNIVHFNGWMGCTCMGDQKLIVSDFCLLSMKSIREKSALGNLKKFLRLLSITSTSPQLILELACYLIYYEH